MNTFESASEFLMGYLRDHEYCTAMVKANERCIKKLGDYLTDKGISYSPNIAQEWFVQSNAISETDKERWKMALIRLQDISETGEIRLEHEKKCSMPYESLTDLLKTDLDMYLLCIDKNRSQATVRIYRKICAEFLVFAQEQGIVKISEITVQLIADFYNDAAYCKCHKKSLINSVIAAMMMFFYEKRVVSYSCTLIVHYLSHGKNQGCFWNKISPDAHAKIRSLICCSGTTDVSILLEYKEKFVQLHRDNGYSKTTICANSKAIDLLILFLEMNGYPYSPEITMIWFEEMRPAFKTKTYVNSVHRVLRMIADYHHSSHVALETVYRYKSSKFYQLPDWCLETAEKYVDTKTKEGWKKSTLDMIRSSITRFCTFLTDQGIRSFREVNASHIKDFNAFDQHKTPQGKNAYNGRIRKFLIYLGEHQHLTNPMLFVALPCTNAPKETVVVVLTEEEMDELNEQMTTQQSRLSLRKKAILLLGLKMGLRASDVVNLSIDDVNWASATIRFVQKKTSVEVCLPMPAEVGNALFRYITEERSQNSTPKIFLSEKAPHRPIGRLICGKALKTALPNRNVEGSGFHVTRKTYATTLLKKGVGVSMVAEALGQRGTASVSRYLSLDTDRMRMCSLSLAECKIGGWRNEI